MAIKVEIPEDEAMFALAALDVASATAHASARKMRAMGVEGTFELDVADTTARKSDAVRKRIADALFPMEPTVSEIRRSILEDEIEFGMA